MLVAISACNNYQLLLVFLLFALLIAGKSAWQITKKSLILVGVFSLFITISYSMVLYVKDQSFWNYFITINIRSFDMIFLTLLFNAKVNVYEALAFSKDLSFLLILSVSKIMTMQRAFADYIDALKSRTIKKPKRVQIYDYLGSAIASFLDKNIRESKENFEAMKSRGFSFLAISLTSLISKSKYGSRSHLVTNNKSAERNITGYFSTLSAPSGTESRTKLI